MAVVPFSRLSPRGKALRWLSTHRGLTERPADSNTDDRQDGIRAAQERLAPWLVRGAWCAIWHANALLAAGVDFRGVEPWRLASVGACEDLARAKKGPYGRGWVTPADAHWWRHVLRGDGAVLFGYGVHFGTVRAVFPRLGIVITDEGNTSSGNAGSQSNGGGSYRRVRRLRDVRGFCLVDYPGGWKR